MTLEAAGRDLSWGYPNRSRCPHVSQPARRPLMYLRFTIIEQTLTYTGAPPGDGQPFQVHVALGLPNYCESPVSDGFTEMARANMLIIN